MKRQDLISLVFVGLAAAIFALIISSLFFRTPSNRSTSVPTVDVIPTSMPDLKNDPSYSFFLNKNAIDLTQPVQIGNSQNSAPFNGSQ